MTKLTPFELEREANIARNKELLAQLNLGSAITDLGIPKKEPPAPKVKPVQPAKRVKRERVEVEAPSRRSTRLRKDASDPKETPAQRREREEEEAERRAKEAEAEKERLREAKKPRHNDLDYDTLVHDEDREDIPALRTCMQGATNTAFPKSVAKNDAFLFEEEEKEKAEVTALRDQMSKLKVVARAKVTKDRIYSAAYHPEPTKDLIFFGDKHGQIGIWDARAASEEIKDEDGEIESEDNGQGRTWKLQVHWPATSISSISSVKFDPIDAHSVYTTAYDCTVRSLSFTSGICTEIYAAAERTLVSSIDLPPNGHEMWLSDALGGVTHLDLREDRSKAMRYQLLDQKIGCLSINPTQPHLFITSSNSRSLQMWDSRKLVEFSKDLPDDYSGSREGTPQPEYGPRVDIDSDVLSTFLSSKDGKGCLRGEWKHDKSVSSAYWDPRGRSIVSTSYDDRLRLWEFDGSKLETTTTLSSNKPLCRISHNCQTGRWLTVLKAQWSPNPNAYPHFTVGNMNHSLDIYSCKGDLITKLSDREKITAVQAVTCSHPSITQRIASGNGSGRCVLWSV